MRAECGDCGVAFPAAELVCPGCQRLVHREKLQALSALAHELEAGGQQLQALGHWREALALLPAATRQHGQVRASIERLTLAQPSAAAAQPTPSMAPTREGMGKFAGLGAFGLLLWKFKALVLLALGKGKLLLAGLTKMSTLLSMLLSLGVYWSLWGWAFALGFVLSIYVHEMGHVVALRRLGIAASPPMFVPGLGAFVRMHQYPATASEDALVGLAGPVWGVGAALACWLVYAATGNGYWAALAHTGAFINLFNLLPVWQLDGGRGFRALTRRQRGLAALAVACIWVFAKDGLLVLLALAAAFRAATGEQATQPDPRAWWTYVGLVVACGWLMANVPTSH